MKHDWGGRISAIAIVRLNEASIEMFANAPEDAMGYHLGAIGSTACLVIGCRFAIVPDGHDQKSTLKNLKALHKEFRKLAVTPEVELNDVVSEKFATLAATLAERTCTPLRLRWADHPEAPALGLIRPLFQYLSVLVGPLTSPVAPSVYGHIPFKTRTATTTICYRFECFPTSRKIDLAAKSAGPGTFASPHLEAPFIPSGFAAVARCALPNLRPHIWRYELAVPGGTDMHCGAVVPLFGQSGGSGELYFPNRFTNLGPIANPIVLPEY